jgi:S-adenosylmethionine-diacylgycerolhomoserine-N-methlytransferase
MSTSAKLDDLRTLWHLTTTRVRGETHAERLESFYAPQQRTYDAFRARMLHGRREMFESVPTRRNAVWIDFGAGTGENAEYLSSSLDQMSMLYLVDLCPALLTAAEERITHHGWSNVWAVCADATTFCPPEGYADVVTFSYSLTMIPDWFSAIEHAFEILKPGGFIGVVDFYVSRKFPRQGSRRHGWATRTLWPAWFACDNVHLNPDHLPMLQSRFQTVELTESTGRIPYLPFVRVPHYRFLGRKPSSVDARA